MTSEYNRESMCNLINNYKTKNFIVLSASVETSWWGSNIDHYQSFGYVFTKARDKFFVKPHELTTNSKALVNVVCPLCLEIRNAQWRHLLVSGSSLCNNCANVADMEGMVFDRLTVMHIEYDRIHGKVARWICRCVCGNELPVIGAELRKGNTRSCGCLAREISSERGKTRVGKLNPSFNHDLTLAERATKRKYSEYSEWRKRIYKRDYYTCQRCSKTGGRVVAHHLYSYKHFPTMRLDLNNGVTLCKECHYDFHINYKKGYKKKCTKSDYDRWLIESNFR